MTDFNDVQKNAIELIKRLRYGCIASCECMTKSPEIDAHKETCKYRLYSESIALIQKQSQLLIEVYEKNDFHRIIQVN